MNNTEFEIKYKEGLDKVRDHLGNHLDSYEAIIETTGLHGSTITKCIDYLSEQGLKIWRIEIAKGRFLTEYFTSDAKLLPTLLSQRNPSGRR